MSGGFAVEPGELDAHARALDGLADRVRTAADAGGPLSPDAYGLIGWAFAKAATDSAARSAVAVERLAGAAAIIGTGVQLTTSEYRRVEAEVLALLRGVR
ncbi:MAG: type VII secretion target [Pseudonocardia sp.]